MTRAEIIFGSDCPNVESGRENLRSALPRLDGVTGAQWQSALVPRPAIGSALLPRLICPACWPACARLLSSMGLGFVNYTPYLLPLRTLFLILTVSSLGYRAKARQGHRPVLMGIWGARVVVVGKFVLLSDLLMYGGTAVLMAASFWSSWPRKRLAAAVCPACVPTERR